MNTMKKLKLGFQIVIGFASILLLWCVGAYCYDYTFSSFDVEVNPIFDVLPNIVLLGIFALLLMSSLLTYTTSPTDLTDAIEKLMSPLRVFKVDIHTFAMMMTIALRFIPTLIDEIDRIMSAQKSRGADFENGNLLKRVKALFPIFISFNVILIASLCV